MLAAIAADASHSAVEILIIFSAIFGMT